MKIKSGTILYKDAKKVIPGGTTLFSKRSELHLPNKWPAYFSKANKITVSDLNGKSYLDMFCAVGTSILGYNNKNINNSVLKNISRGNLTTLNCPEEVILAKQIIKHHPWSSMAKFTRGGGEANALAIRIARANTSKKNVAFCGYHGWHDWYLSANINSKKNLDQHLMSGLNYDGIPDNLRNTSFPFPYNNFEYFINLITKKNIGIVKMEVMRNEEPNPDFLLKIRRVCDKKKIILIFDECTSGYRENMGGIHLKYKVDPDIAIFGKALGSGFAINAIIGKRKIMEKAENTFISSTFWGERIGYTAALASINEFKIFSSEQVEKFCSIFFDKDRDEGNLHPTLDEVVDSWNALDDDEQREDFRLKVASYIRLYSYLSQIINFSDVELEKHYIFYRYLSKKLKPKTKERVNIEHLIDLESLRIQKLHDHIDPLEKTDHEYEGISTTVGTFTPPAKDLLSEIIETINSRYGINLTDDDKVNIDTVRQKIFEDEEIEKYMNGANSEQNKQDYFKKQFDNVILSLLKDRFDFYKKLDENSGLKNLIFDKIYKDYRDSKNK